MKVISGFLKGEKLLFPPGRKDIRPTKDLVREAIFDTLRSWVAGKKVLDLFAGTGALGVEAASHGAAGVFFVESDRTAVEVIRKNVERLNISGLCSIKKGKAEKVIEELYGEGFDLIIADPPYGYNKKRMLHLLETAVEHEVIGADGIVLIEHKKNYALPDFNTLEVCSEKKYGNTRVTYFKVKVH